MNRPISTTLVDLPAEGTSRWRQFWFAPTDPIGLHLLRILAGLLFIYWLLPFAGYVTEMFSWQGWFDRAAFNETERLLERSGSPLRLGWSVLHLVGDNPMLVIATYWLGLGILVLFTAGVFTRLTAVLSWMIVASFTETPGAESDADILLRILAFYLMAGYVMSGQLRPRVTMGERLLGPFLSWPLGTNEFSRQPGSGANVAIRLLQIHFVIVMLASGFHKLQFGEWWDGTALWFVLHRPMTTTTQDILALQSTARNYLTILGVMAYMVLSWQLAFPFFAWRQGLWRLVLLGGGLIGWLGSAFLYDVPVYGPAMMVCCLNYLSASEWNWLSSLLGRSQLREKPSTRPTAVGVDKASSDARPRISETSVSVEPR